MKQNQPGKETCDETPRRLIPVVSLTRCETKGPCLEVCPYSVFEIRSLTQKDWDTIPSKFSRLKVWLGGSRASFVARPDDCHACGLCVQACPEKAITLTKHPDRKD